MSSSSSLTPRNLASFLIDDADVDSANPEILPVQKDEDGDEDDDVEIDFQRFTMYVISYKQ